MGKVDPKKLKRDIAARSRLAAHATPGLPIDGDVVETRVPMPSMGMASCPMSKATICAVTVVPTFAPMITPSAWRSVIMPACTKLTAMIVVAALEWMTIVTTAPTAAPFSGELVSEAISVRILSPARSWSAPLISLTPNRNRPMPPHT